MEIFIKLNKAIRRHKILNCCEILLNESIINLKQNNYKNAKELKNVSEKIFNYVNNDLNNK